MTEELGQKLKQLHELTKQMGYAIHNITADTGRTEALEVVRALQVGLAEVYTMCQSDK